MGAMEMIRKLRIWYLKRWHHLNMPNKVDKFWTAYNWVKERNGEETGYTMPYIKGVSPITYRNGDIIPFITRHAYTGYYQIVACNTHGSHFADYASWDDGKQYDMLLYDVQKQGEKK